MSQSKVFVSENGIKMISNFMTVPFLRKMGMNMLDKKIRQRMKDDNLNKIPPMMIQDRAQMMHNMIKVADRWLSSKNVTKEHFNRTFKSFSSMMSETTKERVKNFEERFGYIPPRFITLSPTKRCNLKCIGCYANSSKDTATTLDFDTVNHILNDQKELWGSHFTVISGGEPFLYKSNGKNFLDIIEAHPDRFFLVYTNGTCINKETAKRMGELGNVTPSISVEGYETETDARRGEGVHKKILQAFENLTEAGVVYGISITATNKNAELVLSDEFIDYYFNKLGVYYGWIFQYMPIGRSYSLDLMVTPEQRYEMLKRMRYWIGKKEIFLADFWNSASITNGCLSAGRRGGYIYIDWNGNCMPCVFNPYTTDNIKEIYSRGGNLNDVIMSPFMKKIRDWQDNYFKDDADGPRGNMLVPCPIKDHHWDMRKIIDETNAQPADENAAHALEDEGYYSGMCNFGHAMEDMTRNMWENDFLGKAPETENAGAEEKTKEKINA